MPKFEPQKVFKENAALECSKFEEPQVPPWLIQGFAKFNSKN